MKEYTEDLIKLTCDYILKSKQIDHNFVDKLADIVVNGEKLNAYVKNVKIKNYISCVAANYQLESGIIEMNLKTLHKNFLDLYFHNYSVSEMETEYERCFFVERAFLHECFRAKQLKMCYEQPDDLESKILLPAFAPFIQAKEEFNNQKSFLKKMALSLPIYKIVSSSIQDYAFYPSERLADIESYKIILEMAKNFLLRKVYFYNEYQLYDAYLDAYTEEGSSILTYLYNMGCWDVAEDMKEITKDLNFDDRLLLGLDICDENLNKLVRKQEDAWHHFEQS